MWKKQRENMYRISWFVITLMEHYQLHTQPGVSTHLLYTAQVGGTISGEGLCREADSGHYHPVGSCSCYFLYTLVIFLWTIALDYSVTICTKIKGSLCHPSSSRPRKILSIFMDLIHWCLWHGCALINSTVPLRISISFTHSLKHSSDS